MAKLEKAKCGTCGGELDIERGDIEGRECHLCRSPEGLMAGLCLGMEANGADPDRIEGWPAIRLVLRKQLGHDLADMEYLLHLKDLLLAKHAKSVESMMRMKLEDVARIIDNRPIDEVLPEIQVDCESCVIVYRGTSYANVDLDACELLQELCDAYPVPRGLTNEYRLQPRRIIEKLPPEIQGIIETSPKGSVLNL